jgi:hypothetical protein
MTRRSALNAVLGFACSSWIGCARHDAEAEVVSRAELGVFYGGQVQERREVSMPSDRPRPTIGFRLTMTSPLREPLPVSWEVDMPGPAERRVQSVGEAQVSEGQSRFDQVISVPQTAALGLWNVRVQVADRLVIDRAIVLAP